MKKTKKQIIYTDDIIFDDNARAEEEAAQKEINGEDFRLSDIDWYDTVNRYVEDEIENLDVSVDGVVIAFANIGRWNGRRTGCKILGEKVNGIFNVNAEHNEWYGDTYNIRSVQAHHDATNYVLFRVAKDMETAERIQGQIINGELTDESQFRKRTRSLYPYVANVYGWKSGRFIKKAI